MGSLRLYGGTFCQFIFGAGLGSFGNGLNTVSESTVSNTELSETEFFGPHRVPGTKLGEFLSAYYLCTKASRELTEFCAELTEFAKELSEAQ